MEFSISQPKADILNGLKEIADTTADEIQKIKERLYADDFLSYHKNLDRKRKR